MEERHPIEGLMITAMNSIKQMIDVNTIIGDPIKALDNTVIIPISKVGFGFAAGGSEFNGETVNLYNKKEKEENIKYRLPFGGGSGAGVNITPIAFLIVQNDNVKLLEATHSSVLDKLVEYIPDAIEKVNQIIKRKIDKDEDEDEYFDYNEDDDEIPDDWYNENEEIEEVDDNIDNQFYESDEDIENDFVLEDVEDIKKNKKQENKKELNKIVGKISKNKVKKMEEKIKEIQNQSEEDE